MQTNDVEKIKHSLELDEKLSHQVKGWNAQKIGGMVIVLIIVLTALGLFGNGLLSSKKVVQHGANLQYERFLRYEKEADIRWWVSGGRETTFRIPVQYLDYFKIENVVPEGYETHISGGYLTYTFSTDQPAATIVHFYLMPQKIGNITGAWKVNDRDFRITHFIYP
ncbi:hypothetical protein [Parapedobacter pyrenivorans]|uniref:hypothetical protein n=1 Tax=Parapedobacter pyrenivorans TaxID=1305674 RepID=UPI00333E9C0E